MAHHWRLSVPIDKDKWVDVLAEATHAYNITVHDSTHFTPNELVFGFNPNLTVAEKMGYHPGPTPITIPIEEKRRIARENAMKSQRKNRNRVNEGRRVCDVLPGELVLLFSVPLKMKKGAKLENRWTGPYRVIEKTSDLTYKIRNLSGNLPIVKVVNATNIKRYYDRQNFELYSERVSQSV